jgi:hypothetical protein
MVLFHMPLLTIPVDDVAYVWWYDNEGTIQSHGINFVQDLPYFLVLLLCFERFSPKDWGIISTFKSVGLPGHDANRCLLSFPSTLSLSDIQVEINCTDKIWDHFGIVGRATQILPAHSQSKDPRDSDKSLEDMELVVKVNWSEASRAGEAEIIEKAHQIAKWDDHVNGHIPDMICSHDFNEYSTKRIREALGIASEGHLVLRVLLFRRLYPITDLTGEEFWKAFWECFLCECTSALCFNVLTRLPVLGHYRLWTSGVEHNDISVKNLMYDKDNENRGILNDYDLAHLNGQQRPSCTERTGTMPFMALDLLADGKIERRYRHDCESFAWVLLWICCRYKNGKEIKNPPLREFITHNYRRCFEKKLSSFSTRQKMKATNSYKDFWDASVALVRHFVVKHVSREDNTPEPVDLEVLRDCRKILEENLNCSRMTLGMGRSNDDTVTIANRLCGCCCGFAAVTKMAK